jgi:hypothetical protein
MRFSDFHKAACSLPKEERAAAMRRYRALSRREATCEVKLALVKNEREQFMVEIFNEGTARAKRKADADDGRGGQSVEGNSGKIGCPWMEN